MNLKFKSNLYIYLSVLIALLMGLMIFIQSMIMKSFYALSQTFNSNKNTQNVIHPHENSTKTLNSASPNTVQKEVDIERAQWITAGKNILVENVLHLENLSLTEKAVTPVPDTTATKTTSALRHQSTLAAETASQKKQNKTQVSETKKELKPQIIATETKSSLPRKTVVEKKALAQDTLHAQIQLPVVGDQAEKVAKKMTTQSKEIEVKPIDQFIAEQKSVIKVPSKLVVAPSVSDVEEFKNLPNTIASQSVVMQNQVNNDKLEDLQSVLNQGYQEEIKVAPKTPKVEPIEFQIENNAQLVNRNRQMIPKTEPAAIDIEKELIVEITPAQFRHEPQFIPLPIFDKKPQVDANSVQTKASDVVMWEEKPFVANHNKEFIYAEGLIEPQHKKIESHQADVNSKQTVVESFATQTIDQKNVSVNEKMVEKEMKSYVNHSLNLDQTTPSDQSTQDHLSITKSDQNEQNKASNRDDNTVDTVYHNLQGSKTVARKQPAVSISLAQSVTKPAAQVVQPKTTIEHALTEDLSVSILDNIQPIEKIKPITPSNELENSNLVVKKVIQPADALNNAILEPIQSSSVATDQLHVKEKDNSYKKILDTFQRVSEIYK